MKIENTLVYGYDPAIRGMRNSHNSWEKSDSRWEYFSGNRHYFVLGHKDLKLASSLVKAGDEHAKFTRMIQVWFDITLPLYLWAEMDTYKIGLTRNSCSTMHTICKNELKAIDFENEEVDKEVLKRLNELVKDKDLIKVKSHLPSSYLLKSTINTNYQTLRNMYFQRRNHKLPQWQEICKWIEGLPYAKELIVVE